jgi:hypothetical protein
MDTSDPVMQFTHSSLSSKNPTAERAPPSGAPRTAPSFFWNAKAVLAAQNKSENNKPAAQRPETIRRGINGIYTERGGCNLPNAPKLSMGSTA